MSVAPTPPDWVTGLPFVGRTDPGGVARVPSTDMSGLVSKALPAAEEAGVWALAQGANLAWRCWSSSLRSSLPPSS